MPKEFQKFNISQKGMIMRGDKCLIVRLQEEIERWDLPGGRIDEGEDAEVAFKREIFEETGIEAFKDFGVFSNCVRYPEDKRFQPYCGLIHLLEIADDVEIKLSFEHVDMRWISESEIDDYIYCWHKMSEMMKRSFEIYQKIK